ncbi:MAG: anhydro-N-acetylmuramic acid kinase [Pedobacter sp.]|nr:MAG: anhydro-N-acetylmuramic acid kinase [Pedobacter sp.]
MNKNWNNFYKILHKKNRVIIGLMSGTSLDGLDIALCSVTGQGLNTDLKVIQFHTVPYKSDLKEDIKSVFSKQLVDMQMLSLMNEQIALLHAEMILSSLESWDIKPSEVDIVASHGQTIFHAPKSFHGKDGYPNATLQIGDGDHIAVKTGIITIADFRQKHIAAGGEGAPLAVYGDYLYFSKQGEVRIMLNIGGIANITFLPGDIDASRIFSTDVGPGNTIMDQFVQANFDGMHYDVDGLLAAKGNINEDLLFTLLEHEFFSQEFPKTTGPELFNLDFLSAAQSKSKTLALSPEDVLATLNKLTATVITDAINRCLESQKFATVYYSGGGVHNTSLVKHLKASLPDVRFSTTDELGINPDAKEAVLFALLANETLMGDPIDFQNRAGLPSISMGKICLPH